MGARRAVTSVAVLIALAAGVAVFIGTGSTPEGPEGARRPAAPFVLPELRAGRPNVTLASAAGKPAVVNFFAAWCEPCKQELPAFRAAAAAHAGISFIGIDHQDSREDAVELLDAFAIPYVAGYDPRGDVAARYGVRGLPATVFIDRTGSVVELHQGVLTAQQLEQRLRRLTLQDREA